MKDRVLAVGQPVAVTERPTGTSGVVRFDLNRSLTGMGHERYRACEDIAGERPPDVVARRIFERGGVSEVHIFSNTVTVTLDEGGSAEGIGDMLRDLYVHYLPGVKPSIPG